MDPFLEIHPSSSGKVVTHQQMNESNSFPLQHQPYHSTSHTQEQQEKQIEQRTPHTTQLQKQSTADPVPRNSSQSPRTTTSSAVPPVPVPSSNANSSSTSSSSGSRPTLAQRTSGATSAAIAATYQKKSESVFLNVYDLHPYNSYLHGLGFGAYHSAVQIFGREYSFGFHDSSDTGVFSQLPKMVPNAVFRESIEVGNIYLTVNQFNLILNQLKQEWTGNKYHLLRKNCNHFSKALLAALGLKSPSFVNRLASAGDMLASIVPSFMLPKNVNALIKDGRPDMQSSSDAPVLNNVPSGRSGQGGIPTLSGEQNWRQIAPPRPGASHYTDADELDDESFSAFLKASEREYERSQQLKALQNETRKAAHEEQKAVEAFQERMKHQAKLEASSTGSSSGESSASTLSPMTKHHADSEGSRTQRERGLYTRKSPQPVRVGPTSNISETEVEAKIDQALKDFQLGDSVTDEEKAQIRAVLRISIQAGAQ